jgi:hypothetical protein
MAHVRETKLTKADIGIKLKLLLLFQFGIVPRSGLSRCPNRAAMPNSPAFTERAFTLKSVQE